MRKNNKHLAPIVVLWVFKRLTTGIANATVFPVLEHL